MNLTKNITLKDFEERRATREINEMKWEEELTRVNNLNKNNNMIKWESEQLPKIKWKTPNKRHQRFLDTHSRLPTSKTTCTLQMVYVIQELSHFKME